MADKTMTFREAMLAGGKARGARDPSPRSYKEIFASMSPAQRSALTPGARRALEAGLADELANDRHFGVPEDVSAGQAYAELAPAMAPFVVSARPTSAGAPRNPEGDALARTLNRTAAFKQQLRELSAASPRGKQFRADDAKWKARQDWLIANSRIDVPPWTSRRMFEPDAIAAIGNKF